MAHSLPRRILMTADAAGGVFTYSLSLAGELAARGIGVLCAVLGGRLTAGQREAAARVSGLTIRESLFRLEWMEDPWEDVQRAGTWLLSLEREFRPDLIHLGGYVHGALPWKAPVLVVGHSCVFSWFHAVRGTPPPPSWNRYRREVSAGLQAADWVIAPSRTMLESLGRFYGLPEEHGVIHNGADPGVFFPRKKGRFFFCSGRLWDEGKNIRAAAEAAPFLPWPVFASGPAADPGKAAAAPGGSSGDIPEENPAPAGAGIRFLGTLSPERMASVLSRAPVFVHPALYEPFGLAVLEAALSGAALVLGDIPSLRELWADAALYVPPADQALLRSTLSSLASDSVLREEYAERARSRALGYDRRTMAGNYLSLYDRMLSRGRRREYGSPTVRNKESS